MCALLHLSEMMIMCLLQVTSKGAGLNPNAKVWQEMPTVPSEAPADGTEGSPWPQTNIPEGMQVFYLFIFLFDICSHFDQLKLAF